MTTIFRSVASNLLWIALLTLHAAPAFAQAPAAPDAGTINITGAIDFVNQYMFRGIRQNSTGVVMWPSTDLGLIARSGDTGIKKVTVNVGFWNSLNTGDTGSGGPKQKLWYESDIYAGVGIEMGPSISLTTTYTAYTSPNDMFDTVKEISLRLGLHDRAAFGKATLQPYVLAAVEIDTAMGTGQADGGLRAGRYLELGARPNCVLNRVSVTFPVKVGMSLGNYYELASEDHRFGFASVAGIVTVPLAEMARARWSIHGGVEYQTLGETTKAFNNGDRSRILGSIGVGFSY